VRKLFSQFAPDFENDILKNVLNDQQAKRGKSPINSDRKNVSTRNEKESNLNSKNQHFLTQS